MEQPKKKGMTSLEAAALVLSNGHTTDLNKAAVMSKGVDLNMDNLQRAHLRRMMGFDFQIKQTATKIHVYSKEGPHVSTSAKIWQGELDEYGNIINEELIDRLVDACLRLKKKWIAAKRAGA